MAASGRRSSTSSRAPEVSRCVAGTQLESCTRRSIAVASEASRKYLKPVDAEHVGDLVRIADRGRDAVGEHAAVEFERRDQRGFDMQMRVDEAGDDDLAGDVDLARAAIVAMRADDAVAESLPKAVPPLFQCSFRFYNIQTGCWILIVELNRFAESFRALLVSF